MAHDLELVIAIADDSRFLRFGQLSSDSFARVHHRQLRVVIHVDVERRHVIAGAE